MSQAYYIPIYTIQGKGGGISLTNNFILNKSLLSEKEQDEILLALQSLSATRYPELDKALSKLSTLFMKSNINWIEVDFSSWGNDQRQDEIFSLLKNAILKQQIIAFSYFSVAGDKSDRSVVPMKLLFKDKSWYLKGYCLDKMAFRTFKITRVINICVTGNSPSYQSLQNQLSESTNKPSTISRVPIRLKYPQKRLTAYMMILKNMKLQKFRMVRTLSTHPCQPVNGFMIISFLLLPCLK